MTNSSYEPQTYNHPTLTYPPIGTHALLIGMDYYFIFCGHRNFTVTNVLVGLWFYFDE